MPLLQHISTAAGWLAPSTSSQWHITTQITVALLVIFTLVCVGSSLFRPPRRSVALAAASASTRDVWRDVTRLISERLRTLMAEKMPTIDEKMRAAPDSLTAEELVLLTQASTLARIVDTVAQHAPGAVREELVLGDGQEDTATTSERLSTLLRRMIQYLNSTDDTQAAGA